MWNKVVGAGRRAELIACWIIVAVGVYRIGQVVWALMCVDCEHHQCQLELGLKVATFKYRHLQGNPDQQRFTIEVAY